MKTVLTSFITTLLVLLCFFHPCCIFLVAYLGIGALLSRTDRVVDPSEKYLAIRLIVALILWPVIICTCLFSREKIDKECLANLIPGYTMKFQKPITFTKNDSI